MRDVTQYQVDGARVPSVTEVLKLCGLVDYSGIDPEVLERARARGEEVHQWIELIEAGEAATPTDPEVAGRVEAYRAFRESEAFEVYLSERPLVDPVYRYAGTPDLVGRMTKRDRPAVIDIKPPWDPESWWDLQVAGYALLIEEGATHTDLAPLFGDPDSGAARARPLDRFVLQLRGDGTYRLNPPRDPRRDTLDFLAALRVAHWKLHHGGSL